MTRRPSLPPRGTAIAFRHVYLLNEARANQAYWRSQVRRSSVLLLVLAGLPALVAGAWGIHPAIVLAVLTVLHITPAAVGIAVWWMIAVGCWARWQRRTNLFN